MRKMPVEKECMARLIIEQMQRMTMLRLQWKNIPKNQGKNQHRLVNSWVVLDIRRKHGGLQVYQEMITINFLKGKRTHLETPPSLVWTLGSSTKARA